MRVLWPEPHEIRADCGGLGKVLTACAKRPQIHADSGAGPDNASRNDTIKMNDACRLSCPNVPNVSEDDLLIILSDQGTYPTLVSGDTLRLIMSTPQSYRLEVCAL